MSRNLVLQFSVVLGLLLLAHGIGFAGEAAHPDSLVSVSLKDGSILLGKITGQDSQGITFLTAGGVEMRIPGSQVVSVKAVSGRMVEGRFSRFDPNYSRLMFAPTARTLKKGEGYISDHYIFFPGVGYGFTDRITVMGGFSILPGLGLDDQIRYVAPKVNVLRRDRLTASAGALYMSVGFDNDANFAAGMVYSVATFGQEDRSLTTGVGLGFTKTESDHFEFGKHPVVVVGGSIRLSNSMMLVSENWLITGVGVDAQEQPICAAIRFFGDRLSADLGALATGEMLGHGFPIPWVSFTYFFAK